MGSNRMSGADAVRFLAQWNSADGLWDYCRICMGIIRRQPSRRAEMLACVRRYQAALVLRNQQQEQGKGA